MSFRIDDRYAWLTFGLFLLGAAYGIRYAISDIVELTKVDSLEPSKGSLSKGDEDSESCTSPCARDT